MLTSTKWYRKHRKTTTIINQLNSITKVRININLKIKNMYRVRLKKTEQINNIISFENWELDNSFLLFKDKDDEITIISKDEIEMIYGW